MAEPRKPIAAFNFKAAVGGIFMTPGGKGFALRLWFWAAAALSIVFIVTLPLFLKHYGGVLEMNWLYMKALLAGEVPNTTQLLPLILPALPAYLIMMLGIWAVLAATETAFHPLRLNRKTFRTMGVQLTVYVCWFLALFIFTFLGSIITAILSLVPILGAIFTFIFFIAFIALMVGIPIRLAPSAALTIAQDEFHAPATRHITKFRFWNLFLAYLVTWAGGYIVYIFVMSLAVALATSDPEFMQSISALAENNPRLSFEATAEKFSNPLFMFLGIIAMIIVASAFAAWQLFVMGVNAYAVKWWTEDTP